jgi:hypothetical protein
MTDRETTPVPGFTPETLNVQAELEAATDPLAQWPLGKLSVAAHQGRDGLWIVTRRGDKGGLALRTFPIMGDYRLETLETRDTGGKWRIDTHSGVFFIELNLLDGQMLRMTSRMVPSEDLLVAFWPRDLYPLDAHDDPRPTRGWMEAAQRGLNAGICYFDFAQPDFGTVLYMQNLSALNGFFQDTKTKPDGVIGGQWPELGYLPPSAPTGPSPPQHPLRKGHEVILSDALIVIRDDRAGDEFQTARTFVEMLAQIYPYLDKPEPAVRDWLWRAQQTLHDLKTAPEAVVQAYGHTYLHPYTASEYPDSMVQMTVLATLREYEMVYDFKDPFSDELAAGMRGFYDDRLGTLRRYLPNVGDDKDRDAVDSWYLYHPLMNLARLALNGEAWAKALFFDGLDFVIRAARHFNYVWPIIYNVETFDVVEQARGDNGLGQTDVGGIYAYVMLQAHQLSGDALYVEEARKALKTLENFRFELVYQTNLTAWGAVACLKMWRLDNDPRYLDQSLVFVAGFLHNCELWGSHIEFADLYANFFGVTCLHDGPYMAAYEAFECFMAFDEYLQIGGDDLPYAPRLLLSEYWRYALDVLWSFYPDTLPREALADTVRNGHIDRSLSFPLEDIYGDGQKAGQVGQEIYGAGAAFAVASRAFAECPGTPYRVFSEYPMKTKCESGQLQIRVFGPPGSSLRIRLLPKDKAEHLTLVLAKEDGETLTPADETPDFTEFRVASDSTYRARWERPRP